MRHGRRCECAICWAKRQETDDDEIDAAELRRDALIDDQIYENREREIAREAQEGKDA